MSDEEIDDAAGREAGLLRILVVLSFVYLLFGVAAEVMLALDMVRAMRRVRDFEVLGFGGGGGGVERATWFALVRMGAICLAGIALPFLLRNRAPRTLCAVAAFLVAWDPPAGTVLGAAVLLVLARPGVALEFDAAAAARGRDAPDREAIRREMIRRAARRHARERREAAGLADEGDAGPPGTPIDVARDDPPR